MENFPQVAQALQTLNGSVAGLNAAIQGGTQSDAGQVRVQMAADQVKQSLKYLNNCKSSIEEHPDEYQDDAKKNASGPCSGQIVASLSALAQGIENAHESFPDNVASELKSVLEEFEKVQSSWEQLAQDNGASADNHYPGLLPRLPQHLDGAFEKLGGR
ncbi:hypothetical protein FVEN_g11614 [Fusarium venenatum]|uniref:Uncharacterized protein n=1 Tax=Fusarium venenatum TaxID=56646 RepID=A0A2L2T939_9HYPO|nr:uncharacterized protein FVRRES_03916 [Fusarium venenatum]KAG8350241.1 hypothetical protein FVEN_g11614 [Fusarium venenatum]CEI67404.1 unnamed protein product [Fusarium venenatum]